MWNGNLKKTARKIALDFKSSDDYAAIFLPGENCFCVKEALASRTISHNKELFIIERKFSVAQKITQELDYTHTRNLFIGEAQDLKIDRQIDFAYFDFIGSMNNLLFDWIKNQVVPNLTTHYRVSFCFNFAWRPEVPFLIDKYNEYKCQNKIYEVSLKYDCQRKYQIATYLLIFQELFGKNFYFVKHNGVPYYYYKDNVNPMILYVLQSKPISTFAQGDHIKNNRMGLIRHDNNTQKGNSKMKKTNNPRHDNNTQKGNSKMKKTNNSSCKKLLNSFENVIGDYDKMRGWKKSLTHYCRNRSKETGRPEYRFVAAIKMRLTKMGYDTSVLV